MSQHFLFENSVGFLECIVHDYYIFAVSMIFGALKFSLLFSSVRTSLLCIVRELEGGGYVAVAVAVSDR